MVGLAHAADPAQAGGVLVLPLPLARLRPLGQPAVLDARDARPRARGRAARRRRGCEVLDAGAGTGFTTEGIVERVDAGARDDARPEPAPARARRAQAGAGALREAARRRRGAAVRRRRFDRYVSAGCIEYWPDPQRGIAEAYRVLRPAASALVIGPVPPGEPRSSRRLAERGCSSRPRRSTASGSSAPASRTSRSTRSRPTGTATAAPTRVAVSGGKRGPRPRRRSRGLDPAEDRAAPMTLAGRVRFAGRFVLGSAAGLAFVPVGAALALRARLARRGDGRRGRRRRTRAARRRRCGASRARTP